MIVRKLRLQRAWSQEQLAELSGLNVRTIQRIERGQNAGLESLKSLAAVFEIDLSELSQETDMRKEETELSYEESKAIEYVRDIKGFYAHLISYVVVIPILIVVNFLYSVDNMWVWWVALGWGAGVISHGFSVYEVFNLFGADWERKQVEKRLGRRL